MSITQTQTREYQEVLVTHLSNGSPLTLPIHTIRGIKEGPTLGVSALVHGDEIIGAEIARRVFERLDETQMSGTVKILPVANPLAFESMTRNTPTDMNNMNRLFPGAKGASITEQIAHAVATKFIDEVDVLIDIHAGGDTPIVDYIYIHNDEALSRAYNFPILYRPSNPYEGTTATYAMEKNIPCLTIEVGGGPNYDKDIERGVEGIFNCMRHLNMIPGEVITLKDQIVVTEIHTIRPTNGGLMVPEFDFSCIGTVIEGKQVLARIYNPRTFELLETIYTPFERNLMILTRGLFNKLTPGDVSFMIGNVDTAEKN